MNLTYSQCDAADIESVYEYNKFLIDQYEILENIDYDKILLWVRQKVENNIEKYTSIYLNDEKAGYFYFHPENGKMEIDDLYIFPQYRNCGIGTKIIKKCISETDLPVFLYVFSQNEKAVSLYKKLGFKITEQMKDSRYIMERS